jgi:hypothetical protein
LEEIDILLTIAEIGVALAGFASLASILGHEDKNIDPLVNAIRFRALLDAGLSAMLLALIGVLVVKIGGPVDRAWQAASGVGVLFLVTIGYSTYRRSAQRRHLPGFRKRVSVVIYSILVLMLVGFAFASTGLAGAYSFHVFFANLILLLMICCTMFVLVIASLVAPLKRSG